MYLLLFWRMSEVRFTFCTWMQKRVADWEPNVPTAVTEGAREGRVMQATRLSGPRIVFHATSSFCWLYVLNTHH